MTDTLPSGVTFVSASPGGVYSNGTVVWPVGAILGGGSTTMSVTVLAEASGTVTNSAVASTITPVSGSGNSTATIVTSVTASSALAIGTQPSSIVAVAGAAVSFQVAAAGPPPLSYQWYFDATNSMTGATNEQLTLTNAQPAQAGNYTVVVNDPAGSITSAPAMLRVLVAPNLAAGGVIVTPGAGVSVSINSVQGLNYTLEYKNSLTDPAWTILPSSAVTGTGGVITLQDASPPGGQRFYEVMVN